MPAYEGSTGAAGIEARRDVGSAGVLLLFPLDMDEAGRLALAAKSLGMRTIGASSAMRGPDGSPVDEFEKLPFVTDPSFSAALLRLIERHGVTTIHSAHEGVWRRLDNLLSELPEVFGFRLCRPDPFAVIRARYLAPQAWADLISASNLSESIGGASIRQKLSTTAYACLHDLALNTPGQTDEQKLGALCDIARLLPAGDMLEVGCLYGRSALALGFLAREYRIGNLICVDPWNLDDIEAQGEDASLLAQGLADSDPQAIYRIFLLKACILGNVGVIRRKSEQACDLYRAAKRAGYLVTEGLGTVTLAPHLSLLHIDGNHRYEHVRLDVDLWSGGLVAGGWLLLDDYVWAFGDGPRRAGDELLASGDYDLAFVQGDTLFLRRSPASGRGTERLDD